MHLQKLLALTISISYWSYYKLICVNFWLLTMIEIISNRFVNEPNTIINN